MIEDRFIEIIDQCIESASPNDDRAELINEAVARYIYELMRIGHIPQKNLDLLEQYLTEEAELIFLKKTYGHLTLKSYKISKTDK